MRVRGHRLEPPFARCDGWLPTGKTAAVCLSVDDVHPARSTDHFEAGGDQSAGALGHLEWLLARHPRLRATLFVTPDWRLLHPHPTRRLLARVPYLRNLFYLAPRLPRGRMRLDRHPDFVRYLRGLPRTEVALHGLHHLHRGPRMAVEFQHQDRRRCAAMLRRALAVFAQAGLSPTSGLQPPGWHLPAALVEAMADVGLTFVASARDVRTPVTTAATAQMSGLAGASLVYPQRLQPSGILHFTTNFQATCDLRRAFEVVDCGGLLAIKAHVAKDVMGHRLADGLDEAYRDQLDALCTSLERRYGDSLWWTSMGEIAGRVGEPVAGERSWSSAR